MFTKTYEWYLRHLTEHVHMDASNVVFVESVVDWCREHGINESDEHKPFRLVPANGSAARMLIAEAIPDDVIEERINALRIRSQLKSVGFDRADLLNSTTKKIAYLFLREYAENIPAFAGDDLAMDEWVFEQMDRIGILYP